MKDSKQSILRKDSKSNSNSISHLKRPALIKKPTEQVGVYKAASVSSVSSVESSENDKASLNNKNLKKPNETSSNLVKLLSRFSQKGNQSKFADSKSSQQGSPQIPKE